MNTKTYPDLLLTDIRRQHAQQNLTPRLALPGGNPVSRLLIFPGWRCSSWLVSYHLILASVAVIISIPFLTVHVAVQESDIRLRIGAKK